MCEKGWDVTGIDASKIGLELASVRAERVGVNLNLIHEDILAYDYGKELFDLAIIANIHLATDVSNSLFDKVVDSLKPQGHLFVVGHHVKSLGVAGPPDPDLLYTLDKFDNSFTALSFVHISEVVRNNNNDEPNLYDVVIWGSK